MVGAAVQTNADVKLDLEVRIVPNVFHILVVNMAAVREPLPELVLDRINIWIVNIKLEQPIPLGMDCCPVHRHIHQNHGHVNVNPVGVDSHVMNV